MTGTGRQCPQRQKRRRKPLTEEEFRRLIETGKIIQYERRRWSERRKAKRRKR